MKKIYFLFALLLSFVGVTHVFAQDEEGVYAIKVDANSGDYVSWNGNASNPWARSWQSTSESPRVTVTGGANNFRPHDGTNFQFFNCVGGSGTSHEYVFTVTQGYEFVSISLDFCSSADDNAAVYVAIDSDPDEVANVSNNRSEIKSVNHEFDPDTYSFAMVVGANAPSKFANTTNLVVKVRQADAFTVALQAYDEAQNKYMDYTQEGSKPFQYGTNPGDYTEESVIAFEQAYQTFLGLDDMEDPTPEQIYELIEGLKTAYEAVLVSKVPLTLADGYYRFRTGMNYNDGTVKYMFVESGETISGKWGSSEEATGNARYLWKLTKVETKDGEDIFDIVSVATDARFNDNPATLSAESEWRFVLEPVVTVEGTTYVNIKYAGMNPGTYNRIFVHQAGHNSGAGTGGNLTIWSPTSSIDATTGAVKMGASEWAIESVSEADANKIIADYAEIKELEEMKKDYQKMVVDAKKNLSIAKDNPTITVKDKDALITSAEQLSSPWTDTSEGTDISVLLPDVDKSWDDQDLGSFWHSNWHNGSVPVHTHYLEVALNEPAHELVSMYIRRRQVSNNHTTAWSVYGSTTPATYYTQEDAEAELIPEGKKVGDVKTEGEWHKLAELSTPYSGNQKEIITTLPFDTKSYQYLRFYIDGNTGGSGLCHLSQFQLYPATVEIAEKAQYSVMGALATNLEKVVADQIEVEVANLTKTEYEAMKTAYDAFMDKFVDPAPLRTAIKNAEVSTAGIVVGTNPGEWGTDTDAGALATTVANAKEYDASGNYTATQSEQYIENMKSLSGDILASANKIQEGKWYRIHFGSKETFEANEWDIETNDDQIVADEYVVNESLWNKYITVAKRETEDVKYNVETTNEETGETTSEEKTATINKIVAYDEDAVIVRGAQLFFDADKDIEDKDLSLFRFINVGDTAYVLQNKATGLFLRAENTTLDIIPSLFNVSAIGYGQNLIAASNIITGGSQSNLHFQRAQNRVVTYGENAAGSRSGLYIEEVSDVESDYDGTEFLMNLKPGSMHAFCFPVDLQPVNNEESGHEYVFYDVVSVADGVVKLNEVQEANPGRPFIFIAEGTYAEEAEDATPVAFKHGYEFTDEAISSTLLKGTYSTLGSLDKGIIAVQPAGFVVNKSNVSALGGVTVNAYSAYIAGEEAFPIDVNYTYEIVKDADSIETTLKKVSNTGAIYTIDGRLVTRSGNLNTLRRLGKGTYIVNGVKVLVK